MRLTALLIMLSSLSGLAQNNSAEAARFICEEDSSFTLQTVRGKEYFYYYRSNVNEFNATVFSGTISPYNVSVKIYGPFDSKEEAAALYSTSTPLVDTAFSPSSYSINQDLSNGKIYLMSIYSIGSTVVLNSTHAEWLDCAWQTDECIGCITGFRPQTGNYVLSAWVKDGDAPLGTVSYTQPTIQVTSNSVTVTCTPTGEIIDGWQRIETELYIGDENPVIDLVCGEEGDCYFDDIRIFPKDASMVTYVYDPVTLRLMAELDERNYAKIYEYDEQGKLIRVKKETEMGVMTIQENRENNSKE